VSLRQSREHNDCEVPIAEGSYVTGMKVYVRQWDGKSVIGGMLGLDQTSSNIGSF
jgi:hypothetical protein